MSLDFLLPIWQYKGMKLQITGGEVLIDDEDQLLVGQYNWHVNDMGYAVWRGVRDGVKRTVRMHRLIMDTPKGLITDHINHNPLDNRKVNLRVCTQSENMRNLKNQGKGYWYHRQNKNWVVEVHGIHRGTFNIEAKAAEFAQSVREGLAYKKVKPERVVCKYGHSLDDAYKYKGYPKMCKTCQSNRSRSYYVRKTKHQNV